MVPDTGVVAEDLPVGITDAGTNGFHVRKADVNDGAAWFGVDHSGFGANAVFVLGDLPQLLQTHPATGALDNDPLAAYSLEGPGFPFHPGKVDLMGNPVSWYAGGIDPAQYVATVKTDIEGHARSTIPPFASGPYWGVESNKP